MQVVEQGAARAPGDHGGLAAEGERDRDEAALAGGGRRRLRRGPAGLQAQGEPARTRDAHVQESPAGRISRQRIAIGHRERPSPAPHLDLASSHAAASRMAHRRASGRRNSTDPRRGRRIGRSGRRLRDVARTDCSRTRSVATAGAEASGPARALSRAILPADRAPRRRCASRRGTSARPPGWTGGELRAASSVRRGTRAPRSRSSWRGTGVSRRGCRGASSTMRGGAPCPPIPAPRRSAITATPSCRGGSGRQGGSGGSSGAARCPAGPSPPCREALPVLSGSPGHASRPARATVRGRSASTRGSAWRRGRARSPQAARTSGAAIRTLFASRMAGRGTRRVRPFTRRLASRDWTGSRSRTCACTAPRRPESPPITCRFPPRSSRIRGRAAPTAPRGSRRSAPRPVPVAGRPHPGARAVAPPACADRQRSSASPRVPPPGDFHPDPPGHRPHAAVVFLDVSGVPVARHGTSKGASRTTRVDARASSHRYAARACDPRPDYGEQEAAPPHATADLAL